MKEIYSSASKCESVVRHVVLFNDFSNHLIILATDVKQPRSISTLGYNILDLRLAGCPQHLPLVVVNYAFDWFIVSFSHIVCSLRDVVRDILLC